MTTKLCPYCNSAKSMLMGNVYCSHSSDDMEKLETGTLLLKADELEETSDHISRLSIRLTLNGDQYYRIGSHDHSINSKSYLIINQGQHYRTSFKGTQAQEMILVAFKPSFAAGVLNDLVTSEDKLLDDPFKASSQPVSFFEKTYDTDPEILNIFMQLRKMMDEDIGTKKETDLNGIYAQLLIRLLKTHTHLKQDIDKLKTAKLSTRTELYRRLCIARDYMDAHPQKRISVDEVAGVAFLSTHHFKRAFKELFNITPHQYHIHKRLEFSQKLLKEKHWKVEDVCRHAGFENSSSFIRLFREHYGCTPKAYHLNNF
jgi:AraC-like DNA-binding protein